MSEILPQRFFGSGDALDCIVNALNPASIIRIATAYFEPSGYQCLHDVLLGKSLFLLVGREQGGKDRVQDFIDEFVTHLSTGSMVNRTRSMRLMLDAFEQGRLPVVVSETEIDESSYMNGRYLYQHAKLYIADMSAVVLTSANMSEHGLIKSREAGRTITDPGDVLFFLEKFDEYFEKAKPITATLIQKLREWLEAYDPFVIYARALLELYGLPEDEVPRQLPPLADYQRPVVSRVLNNIEELGGSMLIASTGLGKTVIAAHTVAYMRMRDEIDSVMVVCPAGLKETWRKYMRMSRTSSVEFSYSTLSVDNPAQNHQVNILEHELRQITEKTLLILDESHQLRNDDRGTRLRNQRIKDAIRVSGAKVLMMTATPFSKNIEDVNNQLALLPQPTTAQMTNLPLLVNANRWEVNKSAELSELPPCFVLTTPTVVKHFSHIDEYGDRFVYFSSDDKRYFPRRLHIRTVHYENVLENLLIDLIQSQLLRQQNLFIPEQDTLFDMSEFLDEGKRNPLFESQLLHQFCSSPAKVGDLLSQMQAGNLGMSFAMQDKLKAFIIERMPEITFAQKAENDPKLQQLIEILDNSKGDKVVIFCIYHETARALAEQIKVYLPNLTVETTAGRDPDKVEEIIRRFAPIANEVSEYEAQIPVDVIIATGALAEGFNLQDAPILINYDLPWTVLQLAQRMGRILRPWREPREIVIYNFIPSTISNSQLNVALNWGKRLIKYSEQHLSFADIPVLLKHDNQAEDMEMIQLAKGLQEFDEVALDLDEVMDFIQQSEQLQTTSFYDDLAMISLETATNIRELPPGIRSARAVKGAKRLFILFQYRKRYYPAIFDKNSKVRINSENPDEIMKVIRPEYSEMRAPFAIYPNDDEFDVWIETSKVNWAEANNFDTGKIQIICAMALIPPTS
jgi:superfamily II DNA or RNA helicase